MWQDASRSRRAITAQCGSHAASRRSAATSGEGDKGTMLSKSLAKRGCSRMCGAGACPSLRPATTSSCHSASYARRHTSVHALSTPLQIGKPLLIQRRPPDQHQALQQKQRSVWYGSCAQLARLRSMPYALLQSRSNKLTNSSITLGHSQIPSGRDITLRHPYGAFFGPYQIEKYTRWSPRYCLWVCQASVLSQKSVRSNS